MNASSFYSSIELLSYSPSRILPSFDVAGGNADFIEAVCQFSVEHDRPCLLASTPGSIDSYHGLANFVQTSNFFINKYKAKVAPHIDHCTSRSFISESLDLGIRSVMYDGSELLFEENLKNTSDVVRLASNFGATVEGELGIIGGKEDEVVHSSSRFPDIDQCRLFVEATGVDLFAPAIGTVHGCDIDQMDIQWGLLDQLVDFPARLVLHGGTGLEADLLRAVLIKPFVKINYATECRRTFLEALSTSISMQGALVKPQFHLHEARVALMQFFNDTCSMLDDIQSG